MKRSFSISVLVIILLLLNKTIGQNTPSDTVSSPLQYEVKLTSRVEPNHLPLNRTIQYIIQIEWQGELDRVIIGEVDEPVLSNFEIIGTASANRVSGIAGGKKAVKEISFILQPKNLGMGYIESTGLSYEDKETGKTHALRTIRIGVEVLSPVPDEGDKGNAWIWLLGFGLILLFTSAVVFRFRNVRKKKGEEEIQQIIEESYLAELKETVDLKTKDRREAFTVLSKLFRRFLSEKYGISALEATTDELLGKLRDEGLEERPLGRCETLFKKSDVVKFSGQEASQSELEEAYTTVETILESHLAGIREEMAKLEDKKTKKRKSKRNNIQGQ